MFYASGCLETTLRCCGLSEDGDNALEAAVQKGNDEQQAGPSGASAVTKKEVRDIATGETSHPFTICYCSMFPKASPFSKPCPPPACAQYVTRKKYRWQSQRSCKAELTGLLTRVIRKVIANDLLPTAADAIRRNVELNDLGLKTSTSSDGTVETRPPRVVVNEGDAW